MKATKYFLILLAVVAMFTFACNTETEEVAEEVVEEEVVNPIDKWIGDVKVVVEEWEAKAAEGPLSMEEIEAFGADKQPLMEQAQALDLENAATEEQAAQIQDLNQRMDALGKL